MILSETKIKCDCCDKVFRTKYYHGGSIEHGNYTGGDHLLALVRLFENGSKETVFSRSIGLDGNFCEVKDNEYKVGLEIYHCVLIWLKKNNYGDVLEWLKSKEKDIKPEFNKLIYKQIEEKNKEISLLEKGLLN